MSLSSPDDGKMPPNPSEPIATNQRRLTHRRAVSLLALLGLGTTVLACAVILPDAWNKTRLYQAYLPELEATAKRDPSDGYGQAVLAARLIQAGELRSAAHALELAVGDGENTEAIWLSLAAAKAASGDPKAIGYLKVGADRTKSARLLQAVDRVATLPNHPTPQLVASTISPEGALPLLTTYARGSFLNRISLWLDARHPATSGFSSREKWASQRPNDAEALRLWGLALIRNRRRDEAGPVLSRAVELAPDSPASHLAFASWLENTSPGESCIQYITCLRLRRDWLPALLGLGGQLMRQGLPQTAATTYAKATQVSPDSADAWIGMGRSNVAAEQNYPDAIHAFQTAAKLDPNRTDYLTSYAVALKQTNKLSEAEAVARRAVTSNNIDPGAHLVLGTVLMNYNETPARLIEAQTETETALKLAPAVPDTMIQLALLQLRLKRPGEAVTLLKSVIREHPDNVSALSTLARASQVAGNTGEAAWAAQRAAAVSNLLQKIDVLNSQAVASPGKINIHSQLATLYDATGQADKATQERQIATALRTNPALQVRGAETLETMVKGALL